MIDGDIQFSSSLGGNLYQFQPFLVFWTVSLSKGLYHPSKEHTAVSNMDRCAFKSSSFRATELLETHFRKISRKLVCVELKPAGRKIRGILLFKSGV